MLRVTYRWDGKPVVFGVVFPSVDAAIRDVRMTLAEATYLAARCRLTAALVQLEGARRDGCVPVPLDALGSIR